MEDPLSANTAVEVFIERFHLSKVWWPPTSHWVCAQTVKIKKKKKTEVTEVAWLEIFALKKLMLNFKVHTRPIFGQTFPSTH